MVDEDAVSRIRAFAKRQKLKPATLAQKAGLSPNALRDLDDPNWKPRYDTLVKLLSYMRTAEEMAPSTTEAA